MGAPRTDDGSVASSPPDVFDYLDYRAFLRDTYVFKKARGRGFSFRAFSRRAGLKAPNHLKRVMDGDRNLSSASARKYADALGLQDDAGRYFCDLVAFGQAKTTAARSAAYERLTGFRGYREAQRLDMAHAAYHSNWYLPAIREMALRVDFVDDPGWIATHLRPTIPPVDAKDGVEVLLELGLLERVDGTLRQPQGTVTTGAEPHGIHIANFHREMMARAEASIDLFEPNERDISSLTLALGPDGLRRLKERLRRFRRELLALSEQEEDEASMVIQLNLQLFPLTDDSGGAE